MLVIVGSIILLVIIGIIVYLLGSQGRESFGTELKLADVDPEVFKKEINKYRVPDLNLDKWNEYVDVNEMKQSRKINSTDKSIIRLYFKAIRYIADRAVSTGHIGKHEMSHNYPQTLNIVFMRYRADIDELWKKVYNPLTDKQSFTLIDILGLIILDNQKRCCQSKLPAKIEHIKANTSIPQW